VAKLRGAKDPMLPMPGMLLGTDIVYYGAKTAKYSLEAAYDSRRTPMPSYLLSQAKDDDEIKDITETHPLFGPRLSETLFHLSLDWTPSTGHRQWDLRVLHIIALYVVPSFFVADNFITLPANPMDALFEHRYYKQGLPEIDLGKCGYTERRVTAAPYLEAHAKRQAELETADETKKPLCTDSQWINFWSKKMKVKEEMYRAMKQRVLYGEAYEGLYDEDGEKQDVAYDDYVDEPYDDYAEF